MTFSRVNHRLALFGALRKKLLMVLQLKGRGEKENEPEIAAGEVKICTANSPRPIRLMMVKMLVIRKGQAMMQKKRMMKKQLMLMA